MPRTRHHRLVPVLIGALLITSACSSDDSAAPASDETTTTAVAAGGGHDDETSTTAGEAGGDHGDEVHFTYEGEEGPEHWGDLAAKWAKCGTGHEQSPIDLTEATEASDEDLPDIEFHYEPSSLALQNNGHTVQATYDEGSSITLDGKEYALKQFHFHAHSEHAIDGETTPLEVHFVHEAANKDLAVIGVLFEEGAENPAYDAVLSNLPAEKGESPVEVPGETIDAAAMLPSDETFFHYPGSLTTPPCSEKVAWQVMTTTVELSAEQIESFTALFDNNARPLQSLGDRELQLSDS